jgi:hypothetical protein
VYGGPGGPQPPGGQPPQYGAPQYGAPQPGAPQYGAAQPGYPGQYPVIQESQKAMNAMICGIIGLVCCAPVAVAALVIGNQAMDEIKASGGTLSGEGKAKAGIIMGWIGVALFIIGVLFYAISLSAGA